MKRVYYDDDARARVLAGAEQIYKAVRVTLGPRGRNVIIANQYGLPVPTHDGVTVARSIEVPELVEAELGNVPGANMLRIAASQTNDTVGDGTTTSVVLAYHLISEAYRLIAAGYNPMVLKRELDVAVEQVLKLLPNYTEKLTGDRERIAQVATIAAGDVDMGEIIADVMHRIGEDGSVTVEQSQGPLITTEIVEGFKIENGFISPYMITEANHMRAIWENAPILITDGRISAITDMMPLLEQIGTAGGKKLVIICDSLEGEALQTLVLNTSKGIFATLAIKAPAFGDRRAAILEDIAIVTGGRVVSAEAGTSLKNATLDDLGLARSVIASRDETTIVKGAGENEIIKGRLAEIKQHIKVADSEFNKEKLEERLANLMGKVAIIKVGGVTEVDVEEKKFRVDDAVFATKAAIAEGIVAGAGVTLVNMSRDFSKSGQLTTGGKLLAKCLCEPLVQLMDNSGWGGTFKLNQVQSDTRSGWGFSVDDPDTMIDLKKAGIIDPAKVTRETIQNAVSIAADTITMGALTVDLPPWMIPAQPQPLVPGR